MISPESFFGVLSDSTRLRALMLIQGEGEACVCELTFALNESQPKISRHLALMREAGIVESRREGLWMHYRVHPCLPEWSKDVLKHVYDQLIGLNPYRDDKKQLNQMNNRPERNCA
jgi:ArsR family transcriptional regulator